jgi:hypothetical protein
VVEHFPGRYKFPEFMKNKIMATKVNKNITLTRALSRKKKTTNSMGKTICKFYLIHWAGGNVN